MILECVVTGFRSHLVISKPVILRLNPRVVHQRPRVRHESAHGGADVGVYFHYFLDGIGLEEGGGQPLFDREDDAGFGGDSDGC